MKRRTATTGLDLPAILAVVQAEFPTVTSEAGENGSAWLRVPAYDLPAVARRLRDDPALRFDSLMCLSGIDLSAVAPAVAVKAGAPKPVIPEPTIACVYHLHSLTHMHRLTVKVLVDRNAAAVPSVEAVWPVAGYFEREVFDLFGVDFPGHHRLERIMCPDDWIGHAGRRDYVYPQTYNGIALKREGQRFEDGPYADPAPVEDAKKKAAAP
jgi:NADH-quinone oxidoreductase subunit C